MNKKMMKVVVTGRALVIAKRTISMPEDEFAEFTKTQENIEANMNLDECDNVEVDEWIGDFVVVDVTPKSKGN